MSFDSADYYEPPKIEQEYRVGDYDIDVRKLKPLMRYLSDDQLFQIALTTISNRYFKNGLDVDGEILAGAVADEYEKLLACKKKMKEYYAF